jgi:hypothetical protein
MILSFEICRRCMRERVDRIGRGWANGSAALDRDILAGILSDFEDRFEDPSCCPMEPIDHPYETADELPANCKYRLEQVMYDGERSA